MESSRCILSTALAVLVAALGCDSTFEPSPRANAAYLVNLSEAPGLAAVDSSYDLLGNFGSFGNVREPITEDEARRTLVFVGAGDGPAELVVFDTRTLMVQQRTPTATLDSRSPIRGVALYGRRSLFVLPDGRLVLDGALNGESGLVRTQLDYTPDLFAGPFILQPFDAFLLRDPLRLFVLARRSEGAIDWVFQIDPGTLAGTDSVAAAGVVDIAGSPDNRHIYLRTESQIRRFDTQSWTVTAVVESPTANVRAKLHVSRSGTTLYLTDPGNLFELPPANAIHRWTSDLTPLPPLELDEFRSPGDDNPPRISDLETSAAGDTLFLVVGTGSRGPLYGPQPARLLVLDESLHALLHEIDLEGWSPGVMVQIK